ncbi:MAG: nucleoside triphosphate pyrophosphohydrolase [Anaerovoracaceae bacterium]
MDEKLKLAANEPLGAFQRLIEIVDLLRKECPWDREQTHKSLRQCMIEEAYEAAEAIDNEDKANLREELGDVLLQVVFHGALAKEEGDFTLTEVINEECEKMIRRHPHVFLEEKAKSVDKVLEKWENIKVVENGAASCTSRLEKVPKALPALVRSYKVQKKAAQVGFDWQSETEVFEKMDEEAEELRDAYRNSDQSNITEELGDLLFTVVNLSRFLNVEPESALEASTAKFIRRFGAVEAKATAQGHSLEELSLKEMDEIWEEVKQEEVLLGEA